ncbi:hypothetical protein ACQP1G_09930 [Nocardia sp. CA-107356]|uniref:hypothetical protein n=1 Tax=Nocardia sp. CA-107356 TaxID=3239972 RepID=UPI003D90458F
MNATIHLQGSVGYGIDDPMSPGDGVDAKLITLVLPAALFDQIKQALAMFGVRRMVVCQVYRVDDRGSRVERYRGQQFVSDVEAGLRIELLAKNDDVADLVRLIDRIGENAGPSGIQIWMIDARSL